LPTLDIAWRRSTVNSVRHAVSLLGLSKIRNAAMTISVGQMWGRLDLHPQWSPKQFHLYSTATAVVADQLALELPVNYPEGAFTAGLLSGIGLLLVATALRQEYTQLNRAYGANGTGSFEELELALLGFPHCELSADILEHWNLPAPISDAVRHANMPGEQPPTMLSDLLHVSIEIAAQSGTPIQTWVRPPAGDARSTLERASLGGKADQILTTLESQMEAMRPFVF